jgi:hypothetical protein
MNATVIIILLALLLFGVYLLKHLKVMYPSNADSSNTVSSNFGYIQTPSNCSNTPGCCSLTKYGCCPDGVNSRNSYQGENCPVTYSQGSTQTTPASTAHVSTVHVAANPLTSLPASPQALPPSAIPITPLPQNVEKPMRL